MGIWRVQANLDVPGRPPILDDSGVVDRSVVPVEIPFILDPF